MLLIPCSWVKCPAEISPRGRPETLLISEHHEREDMEIKDREDKDMKGRKGKGVTEGQ